MSRERCGGRVGLYAGFCARASRRGRRPSISACRHRQALAVHPQASGGPPSIACAGVALRRCPLDLAPGGVYRAIPVTRDAGGLLHHRFTLTWWVTPGGLFSVALSRGSPRVAVSNHPALRSPDFPRRVSPPRPPCRLVRPTRVTALLIMRLRAPSREVGCDNTASGRLGRGKCAEPS
jgi:hypothetical protein